MKNILFVRIVFSALFFLGLSACVSPSVDRSDIQNMQMPKTPNANTSTVVYDNYRVSSAHSAVTQLPIVPVQQPVPEWQVPSDISSQVVSSSTRSFTADKIPDIVRLSDENARMANHEQRATKKANAETRVKASEKTKKPVSKATATQALKKAKQKAKQTATPKTEQPDKISRSYKYKVRGSHYQVFSDAKRFQEIGIASWYGPNFHGKKTANGEKYNMYAMTAAHKTLPLGSKVQVTNLENGKKIVVRINDRGPFHGGRVIDLSKTAAKRLGMLKKGSARVHLKAIY